MQGRAGRGKSGYPNSQCMDVKYFSISINYAIERGQENWEKQFVGVKLDSGCTRLFYVSPASISTIRQSSIHPNLYLSFFTFLSHSTNPSKQPPRPFKQTPEVSYQTPHRKLYCRTLTSEQTEISGGVIFNHKKSPIKTLTSYIPRKKYNSLKLMKLPHINIIKF